MEKMIQIPEWKLRHIQNAIRISINAYHMKTKESCLFREMCKAFEFTNEALQYPTVSEPDCTHPESSRQHNSDNEPDRCEDCGELFY